MTTFHEAKMALHVSATATGKNDTAPQRIPQSGMGRGKEEAICTTTHPPTTADGESSDNNIPHFNPNDGGRRRHPPIEKKSDGKISPPDLRRHKQIQIQIAQSRIVELRHAAKCRDDEFSSGCPDRSTCLENKRLFRHILGCTKGKDCTVARCFSSKRILLHYHTCVERQCQLCRPVRKAIRRNAELKAHNMNFSGDDDKDGHRQGAGKALRFCVETKRMFGNDSEKTAARSVTFAPGC